MHLQTTYLGLQLKNPLVVSSSPLSEETARIRQIEDAGGAAVVMHSLFEEQISAEEEGLEKYLSQGTLSYAEALTYFPNFSEYAVGPETYLEHIRQAKQAVDIPVLGSLNGVTQGGWIRYAKAIQEAGADGLELNLYSIPTDPAVASEAVENRMIELVKSVRESVRIPLAVKIGPFFSSIPNMARKLDEAGADGLVLFNRFYQPDIDIESREVVSNLVLSTPLALRLRLRWVAILSGRLRPDLAVTGGVHSAEDVIKTMMAGSKASMMASALLKNGISHLNRVIQDLEKWMEEHEFESIRQMQGSLSQRTVSDPELFERANYLKILGAYRL